MDLVSVSFKRGGKVYDFITDLPGIELDTPVVVQTARGLEFGWAQSPPRPASRADAEKCKPVVRLATPEDLERDAARLPRKQQVLAEAERLIAEKKLDMQLVDADIGFEDGYITIYFSADGRVDFRELVRDLSYSVKSRIELRQIGARDETRMMGGLGSCGRGLCCATFLNDFVPVSVKMAKDQGLALSPAKISGLCGRLKCCLKYEQNHYEALKKRMPKTGTEVTTPGGAGTVVEIRALTSTARVKRRTPDDAWVIEDFHIDDIHWPGEATAKEAYEKALAADAAESQQKHVRRPRNTERAAREPGEKAKRRTREPPVPDPSAPPPEPPPPRGPRPPRNGAGANTALTPRERNGNGPDAQGSKQPPTRAPRRIREAPSHPEVPVPDTPPPTRPVTRQAYAPAAKSFGPLAPEAVIRGAQTALARAARKTEPAAAPAEPQHMEPRKPTPPPPPPPAAPSAANGSRRPSPAASVPHPDLPPDIPDIDPFPDGVIPPPPPPRRRR